MLGLSRARLAIKYIFFELIPVFFMGIIVFLFVLIMFQSFKLSEYVIVQGASLDMVISILFYMTIGFLPILIPIALLFAILIVYGRMSGDSEIIALKALGYSAWQILVPAILVGIITTFFSFQISFRIAPWGQRHMDDILNRLAQVRPGVTIREGVFSEGFFDLVVYANKVDSKDGSLRQVFIYDERDGASPVTIIAKQGKIISQTDMKAQKAYLRLQEGNIHKSTENFYTKIDFQTYDINLLNPHEFKEKSADTDAMTMADIRSALKQKDLKEKRRLSLLIEYHRRWAMSSTGLIFALLGVSLGAITNRRTARSGSLVICISSIVAYWILFVAFETMARNSHLSPAIACWVPNACFLAFSAFHFSKLTKT